MKNNSKYLLLVVFILITLSFLKTSAQGISVNTTGATPDPTAILDVSSSDQGILISRMTEVQRQAITTPANGLLVYQVDIDTGFYFYKYDHWVKLDAGGSGGGGGSSTLDFTFTADKSSISTGAGFNTTTAYDPITLTLTYTSGNGNPVTISVQGLPTGASINTLSPCGGFPTFTSTLTLAVDSSVAPGTYPFTIVATGGISLKTIYDTLFVYTPKLVFATSTYYSGDLGGAAGADSKCQARAAAAGLSGTYKAWVSTTTEIAKNRISDGFYVRTDGFTLAKNKADLIDGDIYYPININEFGGTVTAQAVWTNTYADGTLMSAVETCGNWTSTSNAGKIGNPQYTASGWSYSGWEYCNCSSPYTDVVLYCFEQ